MAEKVKGIVRIAGTDISGEKKIYASLMKIKGVGPAFANAICRICGFKRNKKVGTLTDEEIRMIEDILNDPLKFGIPSWMLNRRKDIETGLDRHLI